MAEGGAGAKGGFDIAALVKSVSAASGVKEPQAQKVVRATINALSTNIQKEELTRIPGLGVFRRKTVDGKLKFAFKPHGKKKDKKAAAG